jgi:hypothetical protein
MLRAPEVKMQWGTSFVVTMLVGAPLLFPRGLEPADGGQALRRHRRRRLFDVPAPWVLWRISSGSIATASARTCCQPADRQLRADRQEPRGAAGRGSFLHVAGHES